MSKRKIFLTVDSAGQLILSDGKKTKVGSNWGHEERTVKWKKKTSKIKEFKIVAKTAHNPFVSPPPPDFVEKKLELTVNENEPKIEWEYTIHWIDDKNNLHTPDPIISISPSYVYEDKIGKLVSIVLALSLAIFFALKFWDKKKSK